jgi:hypothetical protein
LKFPQNGSSFSYLNIFHLLVYVCEEAFLYFTEGQRYAPT